MPLFTKKKRPKHVFRLSDREAFDWLLSNDFFRILAILESRTQNEAAIAQIQNLKALRRAFLIERNAKIFCRTAACLLFIGGALGTVGVVGLDVANAGGSVTLVTLTSAVVANPGLVSSLTAVSVGSTVIGFLPSIANFLLNRIFRRQKNKLESSVSTVHANITEPERINATIRHLAEVNVKLSAFRRNRYIGSTVNRALQQIAELSDVTTRPVEIQTNTKHQSRKERHKALIQQFEMNCEGSPNKTEADLDVFINTLREIRIRNDAARKQRRAAAKAAKSKQAVAKTRYEPITPSQPIGPSKPVTYAFQTANTSSATKTNPSEAIPSGIVADRVRAIQCV